MFMKGDLFIQIWNDMIIGRWDIMGVTEESRLVFRSIEFWDLFKTDEYMIHTHVYVGDPD